MSLGLLDVLLIEVLFRSFAHFLIGLFVFLVWSHLSSLYILEIKSLSEVSLANTFSHTAGSLFILMRSHLFILSFIPCFRGHVYEDIAAWSVQDFPANVFL